MGGVPLLLMAIAMGITYGWQPDGRGGVDYIIQVPPDQVDEVLRSGEISSVIDPAIRGHVSRVIIKVGNDRLPRVTPAQLSGAKPAGNEIVRASVSDQTPMGRPELVQSQGPNVAMKPQSGGPSGAGMGLPETLTDAAARASAAAGSGSRDAMADLTNELARQERALQQQRFDQAKAAAAAAAGRGADPRMAPNARAAIGQDPNAVGGANTPRLPPFTSPDVGAAAGGGRAEVPTTAPTSARDKQWFQLNAKSDARTPSTDPVNSRSLWPETVGPPDPRKTQSPTSNRINQPLGSTANFAHVPGGAGLSTGGAQTQATTDMTEYERAERWRQLQLQQQAENARRLAQPPTGGIANNRGFDPLTTQDLSMTFPDRGGTNIAARRQDYDPRLSPAQVALLPIGAWSRDQLGNAIDREGRILDETGRLVSAQRAYELRNPRAPSTAMLDPPRTNSPAPANRTLQNQPGFSQAGYDERIARGGSFDSGGQPTNNYQPRSETNSPSDRAGTDSGIGISDPNQLSLTNSPRRRSTLAAQPFFNGLLLMSIVANVYLIVWLKNLRHQFSDMVASKRAAASEIAA